MRKFYLFFLLSVAITCKSFGKFLPVADFSLSITHVDKKLHGASDTTYRIVPAPENTYGYEILVKNKVLIRQLSVPCRPGIKGFQTKSDAKKVATSMLKKLSQGIMPPTIDEKEMKQLRIKF